jgi:glutathionylspermidine synthase
MQRHKGKERSNYIEIVQEQGLLYTHEDPNGDPLLYRYWRDGEWYSFTMAEITVLEEAAVAMFAMCWEAADWLLSQEGKPYLDRFGIPQGAMQAIFDSWQEEPALGSIYGRFDVRFGGLDHPDPTMRVPKLYEFNADTPTSLVESLVQWDWGMNTGHGVNQFNSLHERLIAGWVRNLAGITSKIGFKPIVWFVCTNDDPSHEDEMNTDALRRRCELAGYETRMIPIENLYIGADGRYYSDSSETEHLDVVFKLYPWEHMVHAKTAPDLFADMANAGYGFGDYRDGTIWIEAPYKMLWSTKALLPVLWKLFRDDPERSKYLIPSWFEDEAPVTDPAFRAQGFARKPLLSREGADITLVLPGNEVVSGEVQGYGEEGYVIQALALPPTFRRFGDYDIVPDGEYREVSTVLGLWMIDGEPGGMGIRESSGPITDNFSNFLPHVISDGKRVFTYAPPAPFATATSA